MKFRHQLSAESELTDLAAADRHSILISGPTGCGKTYLAGRYAELLGVTNVATVDPTVSAIRQMSEDIAAITSLIVVCIENLDEGVPAASYTLLKFLEEPRPNVYVVVTCRNSYGVPSTIISRSVCVSVGPPTPTDIDTYAQSKHPDIFKIRCTQPIWNVCRSFADVDQVFMLTQQQLDYFDTLTTLSFNDTVSNIVWKLGHYPDNAETPVSLVLRYLYNSCENNITKQYILQCLTELVNSRLATHAVLTHFVFNCKYGRN